MRLLWVVSMICATRVAVAGGVTASAGGGMNVGTPFAEVEVGRRFPCARFLELYADYSYDAAISTYAFHTFGIGARTYVAHLGPSELFLQSLAGFAISGGGHFQTFGDRLLGPFFTQGVGLAYPITPAWTVAVSVSTGDPVWLRSDLAVRFTF